VPWVQCANVGKSRMLQSDVLNCQRLSFHNSVRADSVADLCHVIGVDGNAAIKCKLHPIRPSVKNTGQGACAVAVGPPRVIETQSSRIGTRHRSMFRYCYAHDTSVGFVISEDGDLRAIRRKEISSSSGRTQRSWRYLNEGIGSLAFPINLCIAPKRMGSATMISRSRNTCRIGMSPDEMAN